MASVVHGDITASVRSTDRVDVIIVRRVVFPVLFGGLTRATRAHERGLFGGFCASPAIMFGLLHVLRRFGATEKRCTLSEGVVCDSLRGWEDVGVELSWK